MLQAMNTGHDGSISTIHCNSPRDALSRLETITMMAGMDLGSRAIREQIASAIQLIVYQQRLKDGTRRFTHVTEVAGMEGEVITLQDIFLFDFSAGMDEEGRFRGRLKSTGLRPKFIDKLPSAACTSTRSSSRWNRGAARCWQRTRSSPARRCCSSSSGSSRWRRSRSVAPAGDGRACQGGPRHGGAHGRDRPSGPATDGDGRRQARDRLDPRACRRSASGSRSRAASARSSTAARGRGRQPARGRVRRRHRRGRALLGAILGAAILQKPLLAGVIGLGAALVPILLNEAEQPGRQDAGAAARRPDDHGVVAAGRALVPPGARHGRP